MIWLRPATRSVGSAPKPGNCFHGAVRVLSCGKLAAGVDINQGPYLTLGPCAPQGQGYCPVRSTYQVATRFGRHGELCRLLAHLGFEVRIKGGHHMFSKAGVAELINLQRDGANAKPYQVKQVRTIIVKYKLEV